jgi:asparagine synthase (glutamine-hydrolysing)
MCGICGIVDLTGSGSESQRRQSVAAMNEALLHRGPDEGGAFSDPFISMAMRRLSIIDLAGGAQPIFNETGDIAVVFNGEIYNYPELKSSLQAKGHHFQTQSDTEVIVHLYEDQAEGMLPLLRGMFAFCVYDLRNKCVLIARDRFGEKPLFYHWNQQQLSFSSELKSLLTNAAIPRRLNHQALPYYFRTSLVPEPLTLFEGIESLPAGHYLRWNQDQLEVKPYFQIEYAINNDLQTDEDAIAFIQPQLERAVARQTISDVPIGAFLSGGIDSSSVVALLQKNSSQKIKTFNVRFEDEAYDESPIARKVAEFWDTDHHEIVVPNYDFSEDIFWTIISHVGVPFRDSSAIPSFLISKAIRQKVKVALSGDGGDELFGGYSLFQWYQKILNVRRMPRPFRQLGSTATALAKQLPLLKETSSIRKLHRALQTTLLSKADIPIALNEMFQASTVEEILGGSFDYPLLKKYPATLAHNSDLRTIMYYRAKHTLPANMLIKIDRMSMANSLEVRAPFLDPDLFAATAQLPDKFLIRNGKGKYILRKIMEKDLPPEVFDHPKRGFSIPLYKYQNEAFKALAKDLIFDNNPFPGLFQESFLREVYERGLTNRKSTAEYSVFQSAHQLWMLMQLFGWARYFKVEE